MKKYEQVNNKLEIVLKEDITLHWSKQLPSLFLSQFKDGDAELTEIDGRKIPKFKDQHGREHLFLLKNITYLGNPHPHYKKRIQLSNWYKDFIIKNRKSDSIVHLWGIYSSEDDFINVDFNTDKYKFGKSNNSSAHVYVNDLFIGFRDGFHSKIDSRGNTISVISKDNIIEFLNNYELQNIIGTHNKNYFDQSDLLSYFKDFSKRFINGKWLEVEEVIKQLYNEKSRQYRQTEWPGWYLEHEFSKYVKENSIANIEFSDNKHIEGLKGLDFDLWFPNLVFQGDLKASSQNAKEIILNDKLNIVSTLNRFDRLWYVIFEHKTVLAKDNLEITDVAQKRVELLRKLNPSQKIKDNSYANKLKSTVRFTQMNIIEINRYNVDYLLSDFNQGRQPSGENRAKKSKISKKTISDNVSDFVLFSHKYVKE